MCVKTFFNSTVWLLFPPHSITTLAEGRDPADIFLFIRVLIFTLLAVSPSLALVFNLEDLIDVFSVERAHF
jgi:hypothetical protein